MKSIRCGFRATDGGLGTERPDSVAKARYRIDLRFGRNGKLSLALTALLLVGFASQAYAQGCAMCLASAMSQGVRAIEAMNLGILILLVPPFLMIIAVFTFLFLRRP
jgi:hypothetical protein